jgi:transglutaminase-like putative cysteine protease
MGVMLNMFGMKETPRVDLHGRQIETDSSLAIYLAATPTVETDHPDIVAFATKYASGASDPVEAAVRLYYAVRDGIRYDPYTFFISMQGLEASQTLRVGRAWCVPKAILLTACCRALGIPAKLGYADVRNHLSTERMRQMMQTDIFYWHGYTSLYLAGRWVRATPAFNIQLCRKFNLLPLEFDGRSDSLFHSFDAAGNRHMEYIHYRGEFADTPIDSMLATFRELHPELWHAEGGIICYGADFEQDVEAEIKG